MNLQYLNRCPKCNCKEFDVLECDYLEADGVEYYMACIDCNFKATFHFAFMGWSSEDLDTDESDEQI